jgi:transcriptional regulator with XRE-family HTH domain
MKIKELIEEAATKTGSKKMLAEKLGKNPGRITEWTQGKRTPDACEIAKIAIICKKPIFETLAAIEMNLYPETESTWKQAIKELHATSKSRQQTKR